MALQPLFIFAHFPPRISIILVEWIKYLPRQIKSLKTKIRQKITLRGTKGNFFALKTQNKR